MDTIDIGDRRELFVDDFLAEGYKDGAALRLHEPIRRERVFETDEPWEGNMNTFNTVLHDGERYRLYYRGWQVEVGTGDEKLKTGRTPCICVAYSDDGVHWERPNLGIHEVDGSRDNNIVWMGSGWHSFSPFLDGNPQAPAEQRYKAVGIGDSWPVDGLWGLTSADGLKWQWYGDKPLITEGKFDSHNLVFWDRERGEYRAYVRDYREGRRDIRTAVSKDFSTWSEPQWLHFTHAPPEQLYTNNVQPYYRAPHIYVGLPARYVERRWSPSMEALPELEHRLRRAEAQERYGTALSDAVFMSSRDGGTFRRWGEAFIRPGLRAIESWTYGDIYPAWGMIETLVDVPGGGRELSIYASEGYWRGTSTGVRRYTLRIDGFVSLHAPLSGGEWISRPLTFTGEQLSLNLSTSAAGHLRVELQHPDGTAIEGFALDDCWEIFGDSLDYRVRWREEPSLAALAGQSVRLRIQLADADLYSLRFC